jgi:hypothetical protein
VVEGARLLSEYTVKSCIVGSNPILSATRTIQPIDLSMKIVCSHYLILFATLTAYAACDSKVGETNR